MRVGGVRKAGLAAAARRGIPLCAVALVAGVAIVTGALRPVDRAIEASRFDLTSRAPTGSVVIVEIDGRSLAEIGQWPWPRDIHAALIDRLREAGAAEIALDIDFSAISTPAGDAALAAALQRAGGSVILAAFRQPAVAGFGADQVNVPIAALAAQSWPATVNVHADSDGRVRAFPLGDIFFGQPILSVPAMLGGGAGDVTGTFGIDFGIDAAGIDRVSAIDVLDGTVAPGRLAGRKIIVGASATELRDVFNVPRYGLIPGALLQAIATETLLQDRALTAAPAPALLAGLVIVALLFAAFVGRRPLVQIWFATLATILVVEGIALLIQGSSALVLSTAGWDFALLGFATVATARELGFRRIAAALFEAEAASTRAMLDRVIEDSAAGVIVCDRDGTIVTSSVSAGIILGIPRNELAPGQNHRNALPGALARVLDHATLSLAPGESRHQEVRFARVNAEIILDVVFTVSERPASHADQAPARTAICATFIDVTDRRRTEERNAYLALFDALTGLPNRAFFEDRLGTALATPRPTGAVLLFDLDRFKLVNDGLGHRCGDLVLHAAGARVADIVGNRGIVARLGGDEFAVLTAEDDRDGLGALAREIITALVAPFLVDGYRIAVGASVGIALLDTGPRDAAGAIREADLALNTAKDQGGGHFQFFDGAMAHSLEQRRMLEVALWDALDRDEFEVAYQPQVDLATAALTGVEALARWRHPQMGWIPPSDFIPVAEATGLIERIGAVVLRRACREIAAMSPSLRLAVNMSPIQFARGDVVTVVRDALEEANLAPSRLELEITESLFLGSGRLVAEKIDELKALGLRFALDDFGTGYSSLSYLRKLPIGKIKIDRSFVTGLPESREAIGIVRAVGAMGKALGIKVNAEGVETPEQARALRSLGCTEGQGFLYGAAVPPDQLRALIADGLPKDSQRPAQPAPRPAKAAPATQSWRGVERVH